MVIRAYPFILFLSILAGSCNSQVDKYIYSDDVLSWEQDIRVFDSLNEIEPSGVNTLLVTGSSSVRLWDSIQTDLFPYHVMQRGYGGAKLTDFNYYEERIIQPGPFKAIVIFVANDITGGENDRTPKEFFQLFKLIVEKIRERNGDTPVFWIETTPTPSRWDAIGKVREANRLIRTYCTKEDGLYFIPTSDLFLDRTSYPDSALFRDDMLHLNLDGYHLWAGRIKSTLLEEGIMP